MAQRPARDTLHPWALLHGLVHLHHVVSVGHRVLRELSSKGDAMSKEERVVGYFLIHGIVESLGQVRETLALLGEIAPCVQDVQKPFEAGIEKWVRFRDDSAHVIDRTHRVSSSRQNDAVIRSDEFGYDTDTLSYDYNTDSVRTGKETLALGDAAAKVLEILLATDNRVNEAHRAGLIPPPPRYREPQRGP